MEFKHTLEVLYTQAEEIRNLASRLETSDEIRTIELDLMLEKLRNIYDLILDLESSIPAVGNKKEADEQATPEQDPNPITDEVNLNVETGNRQEKGVSAPEKKGEKHSQAMAEEGQAGKDAAVPEKRFVSDRFKGSKHTLHEEMAGRTKQEDVSSQFKTKPIGNIMSAIGLNERFELINHLFNGDKEHFEHTVEVLNMAGSFVEAYNYLQENFKWDMDNEYVQRILELIRRKLIVRRNE